MKWVKVIPFLVLGFVELFENTVWQMLPYGSSSRAQVQIQKGFGGRHIFKTLYR